MSDYSHIFILYDQAFELICVFFTVVAAFTSYLFTARI